MFVHVCVCVCMPCLMLAHMSVWSKDIFFSQVPLLRRLRKIFNGFKKKKVLQRHWPMKMYIHRVNHLRLIYGKGNQNTVEKNVWKKRSIFFDLPYWKFLFVRYCLDIMHLKKNVCDSIIGTLLNIPSKTKNTVKSTLDLVKMRIHEQLAPEKRRQNTYYRQHAILCLERRR